jgi:hypothetical protein
LGSWDAQGREKKALCAEREAEQHLLRRAY